MACLIVARTVSMQRSVTSVADRFAAPGCITQISPEIGAGPIVRQGWGRRSLHRHDVGVSEYSFGRHKRNSKYCPSRGFFHCYRPFASAIVVVTMRCGNIFRRAEFCLILRSKTVY